MRFGSQQCLKDEERVNNPTVPGSLTFQNRDRELLEIQRNTSAPYQVIAMPDMGKTSFLRQLPATLACEDSQVKLIDLAAAPQYRDNVSMLLRNLFPNDLPPDFQASELSLFAEAVSRYVSISGKRWLVMLDNAELLSGETGKKLRAALCATLDCLGRYGQLDRFTFVAACREEFAPFRGIAPTPAFRPISLSAFDALTVERVLHEVGDELGLKDRALLESLTSSVYQVTEGLPGLLVRTLKWVREEGAAAAQVSEAHCGRVLADKVVQPYVDDTMLTCDKLLCRQVLHAVNPGDRRDLESCLRIFVLGLSPFRIVSKIHVEFLVEEDQDFRVALERLGGIAPEPSRLLEVLSLFEPKHTRPWSVPYQAARRLLFRRHCATPESQLEAHALAKRFYDSWNRWFPAPDVAESVRREPLAERFYHGLEMLRLGDMIGREPGDGDRDMEPRARSLYEEVALDDDPFFISILRKDPEIKQALEGIRPGFSDEFWE